jgi:hypothetical protein
MNCQTKVEAVMGHPRSVAQKMGIKEGMRAFLVNAPDSALNAMMPPSLELSETLKGEFAYIHLFATSQSEMDDMVPRLKAHLRATGMLWVSWPKGGRLGTDLTLRHVIRIGYSHGLVESTALRVDDIWSALKFTHPIDGKVYKNSYGQLPGR